MNAAIKHYWIKAISISLVAFALGAAVYIGVGIAVAHGVSNANAAHHEITISAVECNCIVEFVPKQPLPGSGTEVDPFVTYNSRVPVIVGVTGVGVVTIEDQHGHVLYTYNHPGAAYTEIVAQIDLPDGLGLYALTVKLDGIAAIAGLDVIVPMYIDYRALPLPPRPPRPPDTGGSSHLFIGGYAVQTFGMMMAGLLFGGTMFFVFLMIAMRRRQREAESARGNATLGKKMRREFSMGAIDKSGVIARKTKGKKR